MKNLEVFPLRRKIEALGLKQKDISLALGISAQYVSKLLNGNSGAVLPESIREFLNQLGVDVSALERDCEQWRENFKRNLIESKRITNNAKIG